MQNVDTVVSPLLQYHLQMSTDPQQQPSFLTKYSLQWSLLGGGTTRSLHFALLESQKLFTKQNTSYKRTVRMQSVAVVFQRNSSFKFLSSRIIIDGDLLCPMCPHRRRKFDLPQDCFQRWTPRCRSCRNVAQSARRKRYLDQGIPNLKQVRWNWYKTDKLNIPAVIKLCDYWRKNR